jgi:hypothetical protein
MVRQLSLVIPVVLLGTLAATSRVCGAPVPVESLKVGTVIDLGNDLGARNSMYNPRSFGGRNYVVQINSPMCGVGCYPGSAARFAALANIKNGAEVRMAGPSPAGDYVLLAGGASNDYFSRIDPNLDLATRVPATTVAVTPSSFDWVDEDTIIHTSYKSGLRTNLYLTDIQAAPFKVTANTTWNANGYVASGAGTRIRNVRVGDLYRGYAYYGDSGVTSAGFWTLDLATGVATRLGTLDVTGDGSWGLWTVKEVDGFLYLHTTHNGIYVFRLTNATTLGAAQAIYPKAQLDALAEDASPNWGFDVVDGGARMLLSAGLGRVIELVDARTADVPQPPGGAVEAGAAPVLSWSPGTAAAGHDVYFGADRDAVANATPATAGIYRGRQALDETSYNPGPLERGTVYYWRIDEVNEAHPASPWKGRVWTFTTADFILVDDMESYTDEDGARIYQTWIDGYPDRNGATVGNLQEPFAELTIVHGGKQSMPLSYDNRNKPFYSEAELPLAAAQDWTVSGLDTLSLFVRGDATNDGGQLYVVLEDGAGRKAIVSYPDAVLVTSAVWVEWRVPLSRFTGVDLAQVRTLYLGVGDPTSPKAGGAGRLYIDDIRVVKP